MADNCSLTCNVVDKDGNVKVSKLWKDLTRFFKGNRKEAVAHYFLTKEPSFLDAHLDILKYDEDGEVTIQSLRDALNRDGNYEALPDHLIIEQLNKELGDKNKKYIYSEALDNVLRFNRDNDFKTDYMAILKPENDGRYRIEVVKRTGDAEYELTKHVENKIITEAIKDLLRSKGLTVDFLDSSSHNVKYSTENNTPIDGLRAIGSILNGSTTSLEIAEIAGHFAVSSMRNEPLVQRLIDMLTPDVQKALFKTPGAKYERGDFIVSKNSAEEAAGILIGRSLIEPFKRSDAVESSEKGVKKSVGNVLLSIPKGIGWLLKKIVNAIHNKFSKADKDVRKIIAAAEKAAVGVADGFITNIEDVNADTAFENPVTYTVSSEKFLSDESRKHVEAYKKSLRELKNIVSQLYESIGRTKSNKNLNVFERLKDIVKEVDDTYSDGMFQEAFATNSALAGIYTLINKITDSLNTEVKDLLDEIDTSDAVDFYVNLDKNMRSMRTVNTVVKNIGVLQQSMAKRIKELNTEQIFGNIDGEATVNSLDNAIHALEAALIGTKVVDAEGNETYEGGLKDILEDKRRMLFTAFLTKFYGKDTVDYNAGIIWKQDKKSRGRRVLTHYDAVRTVESFVDSLDDDISYWDRWFSSPGDCGDFVTGVGHKITQLHERKAYEKAAEFWDKVETLRMQMQDAFGTTDCTIFFEEMVDKNGVRKRTGNFIDKVNHGAWEEEMKAFRQKLKEDFYDYLSNLKKEAYKENKDKPGYVFRLTNKEREFLWGNFIEDPWRKWHEENSKSTEDGVKVPHPVKYHNEQWDNLFDLENPSLTEEEKKSREKKLAVYEGILKLKGEMDKCYPANATVLWRLPQISAKRFSHRYRNLKVQYGNNVKAFGKALIDNTARLWKVTEDEAYLFGSNNDFNEIGEDPLEDPVFFERNKIKRLPIIGVNKLKDMNTLSTDLFGSLLAYGSMAANYKQMESVVDAFEIGKDVLLKRKLPFRGENVTEETAEKPSKASGRYVDFVEHSVYQVDVRPPKILRKGFIKFLNKVSALGGRLLLYGNVHGGIVNWGTGALEVLKEAWAGENYTASELGKAHNEYFKQVWEHAFRDDILNEQRPTDINSLWLRHWNILNEQKDFFRNQQFDTKAMSLLDNRLSDWFGNAMMLPYSSGDHYMQCFPFFAMGHHEKVYDINGNKIDLMDAYEVVDGEEVFEAEKQDLNQKLFGLEKKDPNKKLLGRTPKKLQIKKEMFLSKKNADEYKIALSIRDVIGNFIERHPDALSSVAIDPTSFNSKQQEYLKQNGFAIPTNFGQIRKLEEALKKKTNELQYNTVDESAFVDKARNICNRLHGIYNNSDKTAFQMYFYGRLLMSMRGYALGMINRRYSRNKFNVPQDKVIEGNVNTFSKVGLGLFSRDSDMREACVNALLYAIPVVQCFYMFNNDWGQRVMHDMKEVGFSEHQFYNMRRTGADILVLTAIGLLNLFSSPGRHGGIFWDKDEDGSNKNDTSENWFAGVLYYLTMRWMNEQGAFILPHYMLSEGTSLLDFVPAGASGFFALSDLLWLYGRTAIDQLDGEKDLKNSDLYYQKTKKGKYEAGQSKAHVKMMRLAPYYRSYYAMRNPYSAATSWEYGRKVRGK